jgi:hypothetical protein
MLDDAGQTDWQHTDRQHKSVSRMLGYTLTLGDFDAWAGFRVVALARMTEAELACLAYFTLTALHPEHAESVMALACGAADWPLPWYLGGMDEPRAWAAMSSPRENKAMALACFEALPKEAQAGFLAHIANGDRKRALVALWNSLSEADRASFLDIVDPGPAGEE